MAVSIRPITRADADAWLRLRADLWPDGSREEHREEIDRFLDGTAREPQAVLIATDGPGEPVGFVELSVRPSAEGCRTDRVAYLEGWYVVPGARRQRVGRALVAAAEDWGRARGCAELASDTQADNAISTHAHRAAGFTDAGLVRCFRKDL